VAGIVKLDDAGLYLLQKKSSSISHKTLRIIGTGLLWFAPKLMKFLSIVGTAAMFLVGGSIISHGIPVLHHQLEVFNQWGSELIIFESIAPIISPILFDLAVGLLLGAAVFLIVSLVSWLKSIMIKTD